MMMYKDKPDSLPSISSLPEDLVFKIASLLQFRDLCALSCCSRFWRQLCFSDSIWESLVSNRWPLLSSSSDSSVCPTLKKWRRLYFERHAEAGLRARDVERFLEACSHYESLDVGYYLKAIDFINGARFGFEDVQRFLFKPQMNVVLNLVGVHYCLTILGIQRNRRNKEDKVWHLYFGTERDDLVKALQTCEISDRHVDVKWWKLGGWFHGYYNMGNELHFRLVSLADLATEKYEYILGVLRRGTVHEVLHVQISAAGHASMLRTNQFTQRL